MARESPIGQSMHITLSPTLDPTGAPLAPAFPDLFKYRFAAQASPPGAPPLPDQPEHLTCASPNRLLCTVPCLHDQAVRVRLITIGPLARQLTSVPAPRPTPPARGAAPPLREPPFAGALSLGRGWRSSRCPPLLAGACKPHSHPGTCCLEAKRSPVFAQSTLARQPFPAHTRPKTAPFVT
jgi:hypothetical protein